MDSSSLSHHFQLTHPTPIEARSNRKRWVIEMRWNLISNRFSSSAIVFRCLLTSSLFTFYIENVTDFVQKQRLENKISSGNDSHHMKRAFWEREKTKHSWIKRLKLETRFILIQLKTQNCSFSIHNSGVCGRYLISIFNSSLPRLLCLDFSSLKLCRCCYF